MNGKERTAAALKGIWPDRTPVTLHNFAMAAREAGITLRQFREDARQMARCFGEAAERYELDCISFSVDTVVLAGAVGVPLDFPEDNPARPKAPLLTTLEAVRDLEPVDISRDKRVQVQMEAIEILSRTYGNEIMIRVCCDQAPFSLAGEMRGLEDWVMDVASHADEELIHALLGYCTEIDCQAIKLMSKAGAGMLDHGDSPAGPDLLSPRYYRDYALPYEQRVAACAHGLGLPYLVHICGDTHHIINQMAEIGSDALEIDYKTDSQLAHDC